MEGLPGDPNYPLGVSDAVQISLLGRPDFTNRQRIASDGTINLPLIGSMKVVGKTTDQLAADIAKALQKGGYFAQPVVRVEMIGVSSRYATVLGAVGHPGLLPLDRNYHLSELLARVGGRGAAGADFVIVTHDDGKSERYVVEKLATGAPADDPIVRNGDKIYVPTLENQVFYISGQVRSPGAYPAQTGMTFRTAIARGGGLTEMGSEKKVKVVRNGVEMKSVKLEDKVMPGDVITIGERLF